MAPDNECLQPREPRVRRASAVRARRDTCKRAPSTRRRAGKAEMTKMGSTSLAYVAYLRLTDDTFWNVASSGWRRRRLGIQACARGCLHRCGSIRALWTPSAMLGRALLARALRIYCVPEPTPVTSTAASVLLDWHVDNAIRVASLLRLSLPRWSTRRASPRSLSRVRASVSSRPMPPATSLSIGTSSACANCAGRLRTGPATCPSPATT